MRRKKERPFDTALPTHPEITIPELPESPTLNDYVEESIAFMRAYEPLHGPYFLGFSGGKDSIAMLQLAKEAGVRFRAFYQLIPIEAPETIRFVRTEHPEVEVVRPTRSFYRELERMGPPLRTRRWCCTFLKKEPALSVPIRDRLMGIRGEESWRRRSRGRIRASRRNVVYCPMFHWPEWAVWEFIEDRKLAYPPVYDEGLTRTGCVVCPFALGDGKASHERILHSMGRWPTLWKAYRNALRKWYESVPAGRRRHDSFDAFWKWYVRQEDEDMMDVLRRNAR